MPCRAGRARDRRRSDRVRELPGVLQRLFVLAAMASVALCAFGNRAATRIVALPANLAAPAPSGYCMPRAADEVAAAAPAPAAPPVDQAGCALVKRAYQLGYAKRLGSCAPKAAAPVLTIAAQPHEVVRRGASSTSRGCTTAIAKVARAFGAIGDVAPGDAIGGRVDDVRAHLDHLPSLLANVHHAISGSPHASHHLWVDLPDPHPTTWTERFTGVPRCSTRSRPAAWP